MQRTILFFLLCLFLSTAGAQTPEPVYSFARIYKPTSWYKEQAAAWKKVIDEDPQNALAWYYYYYANRNLHATDTTDKRTHEEKTAFMDQLIANMGKHIPESYEYNLVRWQAGGFAEDRSYLEKANKLGPDRTEHLDGMINWGELDRDLPQRDKYLIRKYEAGQISTGMMNYNYNVIVGLAPNAILITAGDNDTYPAWALQAQGIRKDIRVVNLSLLMIDEYRNKLFKELALENWESLWQNPDSSHLAVERYKKGIIKHITGNGKNYPVYVGLTAAHETYTGMVEDELYLTGLAYIYSKEPVDNMALMKRNFEQLYALDYLENTFYRDISTPLVTQVNRNYIVPMLKLYDHYKAAGETQKEARIRKKLLAVSKGTADEQRVMKYLQQ